MRYIVLLLAALILSGCGSYEGLYVPSCIAYSGSEIRMEDERFVWSKFTDQVIVDERGNTVDHFPGFPIEGTYMRRGHRITLLAGDAQSAVEMILFRVGEEVYLYTAEEAGAFESTGKRPVCPLQLQSPAGNL